MAQGVVKWHDAKTVMGDKVKIMAEAGKATAGNADVIQAEIAEWRNSHDRDGDCAVLVFLSPS
jgi:hypothetical protein